MTIHCTWTYSHVKCLIFRDLTHTEHPKDTFSCITNYSDTTMHFWGVSYIVTFDPGQATCNHIK